MVSASASIDVSIIHLLTSYLSKRIKVKYGKSCNVVKSGIDFNRNTHNAFSCKQSVLQIQPANTLGLRQINLQNHNHRNHPQFSKFLITLKY